MLTSAPLVPLAEMAQIRFTAEGKRGKFSRMKKLVLLFATLAVASCLFFPPRAIAAPSETNAPARTVLPGEQIAHTASLITGVAISPLLGVGCLGAWQYYQAKSPEQQARLPWFANPYFWVPALLLALACFVKDTAGTALPTALKKPLDVIDALEHKISGLIAVGAFVPVAAAIFQTHSGEGATLNLSAWGLAVIDPAWLYNALIVPLAMVAFFMVFLASNAINILILLSPFTTVDLALKAFRTVVLASVVASAWANPWLGALWALMVIGLSSLIAGWSFRLSCLGFVFIWDLATGRCRRFQPDKAANKMFLSRQINEAPARTYGKLVRDDQGRLAFHYHPWLVLPRRTLRLPEGKYEAGCGLGYSEILRVEGDTAKTLILLPPRYRGHEDELVIIYKLAGTRAVGLRAAWKWFKGMFASRLQTSAV